MPPARNACIDFDGVLNDWRHSPKKNGWGPPVLGSILGMQHLRGMGLRLVVYTVKAATPAGEKVVRGWLDEHHVPYDDVTAIKPQAVVYLDDRAVPFSTWQQAVPDIRQFLRQKP